MGNMYFLPNNDIVIRAIINRRIWLAQSAQVIKDDFDETVLWITEHSQFAAPENYINDRANFGKKRWKEAEENTWNLSITNWKHTNCLIIKNIDDFYSVHLFWSADTNDFLGYYVNFELPYSRDIYGFNTLDLDLDIIVNPNREWQLKDVKDYQKAIDLGGIKREWTEKIDSAKQLIIKKIELGQYPFNNTWVNWKPDEKQKRSSVFMDGWDRI